MFWKIQQNLQENMFIRVFFDKVATLTVFGIDVLLSTWWISPSHLNFISPCKLIFLARCIHQSKFLSSMFTVSTRLSKYFRSISNDCNHLVVNPRPRGSLYEKKTCQQQSGQPSVSVSWNDFNFHLHEKFCPGLQGWICHLVLFWV